MSDRKIFTLKNVDDSLKMLNIRPFDGDTPSPLLGISLLTIDSNLHQHGMVPIVYNISSNLGVFITAMQMWSLARFLPLAIGHMIPEGDDNWENFLHLLEIVDILFARRIPTDECGYLESLIHDHHQCFRELYPDVPVTMKFHSMIHMPRLIME